MIIGIIGAGFCGNATKLFKCSEINIMIYDIIPTKCIPENVSLKDLTICDIVFICINTPLTNNNKYYTNDIENIITEFKSYNYNNIILRSTITPEFCNKYNITFMPEFLTENNWENDFYNCNKWIIGLNNEDYNSENNYMKYITTKLINTAHKYDCIKYNKILYTSTNAAELCKLVRNSFLATKVSFFNEIYNICKFLNIDYNNEMRDLIISDNRIGDSHTNVPNNNKYGYGGSCFPKDLNALSTFCENNSIHNIILSAVNYRNETYDRPEKEWKKDPRSFK